MTKTVDFAIGKKLPLDILMQPVFLGGGRGSGKTSGAKTLYEAAHDAGAQCIAIAPTGKWWSLRIGADGKSPGLDAVFVFGGPHADVPLTPESGPTIAKTLVEKRVHAVLDVSLMRKGERARFLAAFLEEFWLLKKLENESFPVVLFIEEAHAVIPQRPQPDEARMLGAAEDLVREGRNHGIGVVLLDQRAAVVNKNVLALVEVLIVLRTIHHLDRKPHERELLRRIGDHVYAVTKALVEIDKRLGHVPVPRTVEPDPVTRFAADAGLVPASSAPLETMGFPPGSRRFAKASAPRDGEAKMGKGEIAVLTAIAQHRMGATREQLSVLTGYKRSSRDKFLQQLTAAGLVEHRGERIHATDAGDELLGEGFEPLPTGVALRDHWFARLPEGERRILEVLLTAFPRTVHRDELDQATGYKRSSRDKFLQHLTARRLIETPSPGEVIASETLFA